MIAERTAWEGERDAMHGRGMLGASEVAAAAGVSPYVSRLKRYAIDAGLESRAVSPETQELFRWGHLNQPTILQAYADESGRTLKDFGDYTIQTHKDFPRWWATLDGGVEPCDGHDGPGIVEAKNVGARSADRWDDGVPAEVEAQMQVQMAVTDCTWGSAAALFGGNKFLWWDVERNDAAIAWLYQQTVKHWERIRAGEPPAATPGDAATLLAMFPKHVVGKVVKVDEDAAVDFVAYTLCKKRENAEKASAEAHRVHILEAAEDAEIVELPDGTRYSVKEQKKKAHPVAASTSRVIRKLKMETSGD